MRTTLNIDEDVLQAVKEIARLRGSTAGAVLSSLARAALRQPTDARETRNGVPLLDPVEGAGVVTSEHVADLMDDS